MGRARPKGENEGRGKTSGATPGIPFAFVRRAFSLSRASFLSLSLSRLVRYCFLLRRPSLRLFSRIRALHTRVSSRSHTDINRDRILTYCLIIGPPREAACFSIPSLSLWLRDPRDERW